MISKPLILGMIFALGIIIYVMTINQ